MGRLSSALVVTFLISSTPAFAASYQLSQPTQPQREALALSPVQYQYEIRNTGKSPLVLIGQSTPGAECTPVQYSKEPIFPGQKKLITIECSWFAHGTTSAYRQTNVLFLTPEGERISIPVESVVVSNFTPVTNEPDTCAVRKKLNCESKVKKIRRLCFLGTDLYSYSYAQKKIPWEVELFCSSSVYDQIYVSSAEEMQAVIADIVENTCDKIEAIAINEHGNVGSQGVGANSIDRTNVNQYFAQGAYECALVDNARLILGGCLVGHGCGGHHFMVSAAQALAPTKRIQVQASEAIARTDWTGISSRTGSTSGRDFHLSYQAGKETWSERGLFARKKAETGVEACISEWTATPAEYLKVKAELEKYDCFFADFVSYLQKFNQYKVKSSLYKGDRSRTDQYLDFMEKNVDQSILEDEYTLVNQIHDMKGMLPECKENFKKSH